VKTNKSDVIATDANGNGTVCIAMPPSAKSNVEIKDDKIAEEVAARK
jgi:hypothetical protein